MGRRPAEEDLTGRIRELEEEILQLRNSVDKEDEKHRRVLENIEEGYYELDLKGNIISFNRVAGSLLGYEAEEILGKSYREYTSPATARRMYEVFHRIYETGCAERLVNYEVMSRDGSVRTHEMSAGLMKDDRGDPRGFHVLVRDVTARKEAEMLLKRSEERYRTIFENTGNATILIAEDTTILLANSNFERLTGYTKAEIEGKMSWTVFVVPEDLERMKRSHAKRRQEGRGVLPSYEFRLMARSGDIRDIFLTVALIPGTEESLASCMDITDRKRAEMDARRNEERYRSILESMEEAYYEVDLKGNFTFFNSRAVNRLGYTIEELSGMNYRRYMDEEEARKVFDAYHRVFRTGEPTSGFAWQLKDKTGKTISVEASISLRRDAAGRPIGFMGVVRDITQRKKAEAALRQSEERYRTILEIMDEAYFELDLTGNYTYVNDALCRIMGYARAELLGMNNRAYTSAETAKRAYRTFAEILRTGVAQTMVDYEVIRKDGTRITVEFSASIMRGLSGEVVGFKGVGRDVTERIKAEKALKDSERKYRLLAENLRDVIWVLDADLKYVYVSPSVMQLRGYTPEEAMKQTMDQVLAPESYQHAVDLFTRERAFEFGGRKHGRDWTMNLDLEMIRKDGSRVWTEVTLNILYDEHGEPEGLLGITHDISDRRKAEEAIRQSEERYRTIFENTATANIIVAEDTTILLANANFEKLVGYSREELEGKMSWTSFVAEEDLEIMKQRHTLRRTDPGAVISAYEFKARVRSGEIRNLYMSVSMIPGTRESVASLIDMTDRRKAEDALRQSEERFRDLARLLPETVFEMDTSGKVTFINEISLERFGFTLEDLERGVNVLDVMAPHDHERAIRNYTRVMQGERLGLNEYTARKKDGTTFPVLIHTTPICREGEYVGLRGFLVDVTEKKSLEEQLMRAQKLEAIGTLAGGIAHDFNNLLMGILGNISLMLMHYDESHAFHDRLKSMEEYVQRGSGLTKQLLGFARGGKYEVKPTDLGEFVRRSAEMFGRTKREIRIHHKSSEDLWAVEVDRGQMEQVMLNLFVNSWQAMPGGGDLYLSVENAQLTDDEVSPYGIGPGRFVKVTVTDTGIGMDEAIKARIFEPFFSTKERGRGTGLGLASVYGIIKNHGGFVLVESEKDIGTSFMVYLPASQKVIEREKQASEKIHTGRETILVIDDEEMIVEVGAGMLESLGYRVLTANGGRQGLQIFDQNRETIDLVILDMIMPDFGGRETFEALRRQDPGVKVLLSSGYSLDGQAKEILTGGCRGFIQKPFTMAELSKKIRHILDGD
ncbi:MAG TPA: PAS domain S-box protein [Deltaproteobacteria bacterium]|nr:PAS domain S-box protein [Deltaproteobacteria bacterium]